MLQFANSAIQDLQVHGFVEEKATSAVIIFKSGAVCSYLLEISMTPGVGVTPVDDSAPSSPEDGQVPRVYLCGDRKKNGTFFHLLTQWLLST